MNRKPLNLIICFLTAFSVFINVSIPTVKAEEVDLYEQQKLTSHLLINLFLEKLDQDELVIFEHVISRADLQPRQVSYVQNMVDDTISVHLCFNLQKTILVPKFEHFYVDKITVETDKDGAIIQVRTHVTPVDKED